MGDKNFAAIDVSNGTTESETTKLLKDILRVVSKEKVNRKEIHTKALDDLVNVNSLFTIAVFVGLAFANRDQHALEDRSECDADPGVRKRLIVYEVVSFGCFLLSSLVAKSLKVYLNIYGDEGFNDKDKGVYNYKKLGRGFMFLLSVLASVVGVVFLTLSMANVVQIKVGKLSCGSWHARAAVISLSVLVLTALIIYLPSMLIAIGNCMLPDKYWEELKSRRENISLVERCCMPFILSPASGSQPILKPCDFDRKT